MRGLLEDRKKQCVTRGYKLVADDCLQEEEKARIARSGGNPDLEILRRRDQERLEAARIEFEAEQRVKQMTITQSLLDEEEAMDKRKKKNPWLFPPDEKTEKVLHTIVSLA